MNRLFAISVLLFLLSLSPAFGQERGSKGSSIWEGKTFTRNTYEEDIKDTLTAISKLAGIPFTFGDGITDTVTMEFKNMPLKDAFDFLIHQYDLEYTQDAHAIHIFKPGAGGLQDAIITLQHLDVKEAKSALERLGLVKKETKIVYDSPTSSIFVTGPARDVKNIKDFIALLEQSRKKVLYAKPEIRYYTLRFAKVSDIQLTIGSQTVTVRGLTNVLTEILGLTRAGQAITSKIGLSDRGGRYVRPDRSAAYDEFRRQAGEMRYTQPTLPAQQAVASQQESQAQLLKEMVTAEAGTIADDPRTNRIIIRDYPEKLDEYGKIIRELDKPVKMVKIDVIIVQASDDFTREFGMGRTFAYDSGSNSLFDYGTSEPSRNVINNLASPPLVQSTLVPLLGAGGGAGAPPAFGLAGTFLYQGSKFLLANTLQATEEKGISKTINKSSVVTMDNMQSIIETKTTITYKIQSGGLDPVVQSEDIDAGLKLTVTPHIIERNDDRDDMIEMTVAAERSFFLATRTDDIPEKASTSLTTQAVIGDDATLVVGGNFERDYSRGATGTPCIMDVPVVGYAFKMASAQDNKTNILFFISPNIISLDAIPYEGPELKETVDKDERELMEIDPNKPKKLIEKHRDLFKDYSE